MLSAKIKTFCQYFISVSALCLFVLTALADTDFPILRHMNYLALQPNPDSSAEIKISCKQAAPRYLDILQCRLIQSKGFIADSGEAVLGQTLKLKVPASAKKTRMALEMVSGNNLAIAQLPPEMPWALVARSDQPLRTIREWGPFYFFVPDGTKRITFWVYASAPREAAHIILKDPDGKVMLDREDDFNSRTRINCKVPKSHAGKVWSLALVPCTQKGFYTDDVTLEFADALPGLLSPRPEWAELFSQNDDAPATKNKASVKPVAQSTRTTYSPLPKEKLDAAFARRDGIHWRTSLPFTYVLDYGSKHVNNSNYVATVASAPPTLLHFGKDVPFNHGWGAVRSFGGENVAHGKGEAITRLSPDEVASRITDLRTTVEQLHSSGVRLITPYVCSMTLNGDPVKRSGFWEFYDHWNSYRSLGLAAKPAQDPQEWLQTKPDGSPRIYYKYDQSGFYPAFKVNHRFSACWRSEGWRTWLLEVVRFVARTGCDGVFVDNGNSQKSFTTAALTAFRKHLKSRYTPEQARDLLGITDLDSAEFPDKKSPTLANFELNAFWASTTHEQMAAIKAAGSQILGREFIVFPNGGRIETLQRAMKDSDFVMFERSIGPYGTHPGLVLHPILEGVTLRSVNDNIFEHLFVRSLRARVRPLILTRGGYPRTIRHLDMNPNTARLGMAECAAFSGGGGFLLRPRFDMYGDALNEYREFTESHQELYVGLLPWRDTVVLLLPEQKWLDNRGHIAAVKRITPILANAHVRFEFASESRLDADPYADAQVVAAYNVSVLADNHLQALANFATRGGTLLVSGALAEKDSYMQPRAKLPPPLDQLSELEDGGSVKTGKGMLVRRDSEKSFSSFLGDNNDVKLTRADGESTEGIRMATYRSPERSRIVNHLVNYMTPMGRDNLPVEEVTDLSVELPLPKGKQLTDFRALTPDCSTRGKPSVTAEGDKIKISIPHLHIYTVVELSLEDARSAQIAEVGCASNSEM